MKNFKRFFIITSISILILCVIIIACISPIAKYLVEKYDMKYTGRQIKINSAYVNPFTGYIQLNKLKIYEFESDSIFLSAKNLKLNFGIAKLFKGDYEVGDIELNEPIGFIIQNNKYFNFNDLIHRFSKKTKSKDQKTKGPLHLDLLDIKINNGTFHYKESLIPISYFIKNVNIESPGVMWKLDTIATKFSFISGYGTGKINGNLNIHLKNLDYRVGVKVEKFDLSILEQYLKDISREGKLSAILNANIKSTGNFLHRDSAEVAGNLSIEDFHLGKDVKEDYVFFKTLSVSIKRLNPSKLIYLYDSISLNKPYIKYERYDYLDNFQSIFGSKGQVVAAANSNTARFNLILEVAKYIKFLSRNFFSSNYKIGRLAIYNADINFSDYSLSEKFSASLFPLNASADTIDKAQKRLYAYVNSGIKPFGNCAIALSINPMDSSDFNLNYKFNDLSVAAFNPFILNYTSFALNKGTIDINGRWIVKNGNIQSTNNLLILDPRVAERSRQKGLNWIPMRLAMFFVRESGNAIEYEIPVSGKLDNVKLHWRDVILDILKNIVIKPLTTPYRMHVKNVETKVEESLALTWELRRNSPNQKQRNFLKKMAEILKDNKQASINVYPQQFTEKEMEYILLFEAKKRYILSQNNRTKGKLSEDDSTRAEKMSIKDKGFIEYLNKIGTNASKYTVQQKCAALIGNYTLQTKLNQLNARRSQEFMIYFKEEGVENQVKILNKTNMVPFNGFSYYKIKYLGEIPESLMDAYRKMNQLNDQEPRSKFKRRKLNLKDNP